MGHFERAKSMLKILPTFLIESMFYMRHRPFQRDTVDLCRTKDCKVTSCQSWRFEKKFCHSAIVKPRVSGPGSSPGRWNNPQSLTDRNFAAL